TLSEMFEALRNGHAFKAVLLLLAVTQTSVSVTKQKIVQPTELDNVTVDLVELGQAEISPYLTRDLRSQSLHPGRIVLQPFGRFDEVIPHFQVLQHRALATAGVTFDIEFECVGEEVNQLFSDIRRLLGPGLVFDVASRFEVIDTAHVVEQPAPQSSQCRSRQTITPNFGDELIDVVTQREAGILFQSDFQMLTVVFFPGSEGTFVEAVPALTRILTCCCQPSPSLDTAQETRDDFRHTRMEHLVHVSGFIEIFETR